MTVVFISGILVYGMYIRRQIITHIKPYSEYIASIDCLHNILNVMILKTQPVFCIAFLKDR